MKIRQLVCGAACAAVFACTLLACQPLAAGSEQRSPVDGMTLVYVPAGEFSMGSNAGSADEQPEHRVYLDAFWIDKTEVSNGMYLRCIQAGGCQPLAGSAMDLSANPNLPVQGVAWHEAVAYCAWVGRRLPTEAEWEKAAGGTDGRIFPWGNQLPAVDLANFGRQVGGVSEIGSYPAGASPYGALDMAGNVYEWVSDWYAEDYYANSPREVPGGPMTGMQRVLRGGNWSSNPDNLRSANRFWAFPGRNDFDGFRCVMDA
jgi:formylglycine-generating enzyme required for sulfatase activity